MLRCCLRTLCTAQLISLVTAQVRRHNSPGSEGLPGLRNSDDVLDDFAFSAAIFCVLGNSSEDDDAMSSNALLLRAFCGLLTGDGGKFRVDWRGSSRIFPFGLPVLFFRATFIVLNFCVRSGAFLMGGAVELDATGIVPLRCSNSAIRFAR